VAAGDDAVVPVEPGLTDLRGAVAHVTAGGAGIGRGIALSLARVGARVVVSDVDEEWGPGTVELIETAGGEAAFVRADATVEQDLRDALEFTEERFGGLDVLVNNAGGAPAPYFPEADPNRFLWSVALNLHSAMVATYYAIGAMKRRGGGSILNVSSRAGIGFEPHRSPEYSACKAALWRFTATLAPLADDAGIRVNCICPDWVETERMREQRLAMGEERWAKHGPTDLVSVEEIAHAVVHLLRDQALAGRTLLCPYDGPWGLVPVDDVPRIEPVAWLER
jgi:NAD(P)-dependent dehydrogenase (short-subunit alcohol dehydrogenase family)